MPCSIRLQLSHKYCVCKCCLTAVSAVLFILSAAVILLPRAAFFGAHGQALDVHRAERQQKYLLAKEALYSREFAAAYALFSELGDYADSAQLAAYSLSYPASEPEYGESILSERWLSSEYPGGKLYDLTKYGESFGKYVEFKGLVYVPDEISFDTAFVQYYAGGAGNSDYLWYSGVYGYFKSYEPNAIIVFTNESGTTRISYRNQLQWSVLRQLAYECGTVVHDLSVIGSSAGCYTAMQLAYTCWAEYGLSVKNCVTLDTGSYWELTGIALSVEQCEALAQAGTKFYLFEEADFKYDLEKDAVENILESGLDCSAVICRHGQHSVISQNAYMLGVFSFCAGEDIELPEYEYHIISLDDRDAFFEPYEYPPKPDSDTRKVY